MAKIKYNKEKSGKLIGRGGPRDIQMRQRLIQEEIIRRQAREVETETGLHPRMVGKGAEPPKPTVDLSQYLPLSEVRKKIDEAVEYTRKSEQERFNSGLKNLNDQLNESRRKFSELQEQLINKNAEVKRLRDQLTSTPEISDQARKQLDSKELEIAKLRIELDAKENLLQTKDDIYEKLSAKMDKIYERVADGSITSFIGKGRPELEDKIFIDPIEEEKEMDAHIEIKEDEDKKEVPDRDISSDLNKLRNLLKMK
jgi:DNA repair exonuclease SbcCD ATPase subunit